MRFSVLAVYFLSLFLLTSIVHASEHRIDPVENCFYLNQTENLPEKGVKVMLKLNTTYSLSLKGNAYFSEQTGTESDPMPGVVVFYPTNREDGFDSEYVVLRTGENITFTTPSSEQESVFLIAFCLDYWPKSHNVGEFILKVTPR